MRPDDARLKLYRGSWYAVWRERGATRRRALRTKDRGEAERALRDFRKAAAAPRETIGQILPAYLEERREKPSHPSMVFAWRRLAPHFEALRPTDVTRRECRAYAAMRRRRVKDGTIIKELSLLRAALYWQDRNTPAEFELPRAPAPRNRSLSRGELRSLIAACNNVPHCGFFIVLAYSTAGRAGAILGLTWERVDFARGLIDLGTGRPGKGRAIVPMTESARAALEKAKTAALSPWVIEYAGRRVRSIKRAFAAAARRAGLAEVSPHVLRHTAAVHMAERGVPMSEISQYLGHSSTAITERIYARYSPNYLRRAAAALE